MKLNMIEINVQISNVHGLEESIAKISLLPNTIYRFNSILIKMFITFFTCLGKIILKFEWKHRRPQAAKAILRKRRKSWRAQNQIDQWKRENPEIDPTYIINQFLKTGKNNLMRKR